jgi:outer membrane protein TolC
MRENPELASSSRAAEASQASYKGSFNGFLPQLTFSNSYTDSNNFASSGSGGTSVSNHWQAQAQASLNIFDASRIATIQSSSASLAQAQANRRAVAANVRFSLRRAFFQLLFAQKSIEVSNAILAMREKNSALVSLRYDSGRESKGNMLRSKAQHLQAQADLSQALRELRISQKALSRHLGLDDFSPLSAAGELQAPPVPEMPRDLRPMASTRPDLAIGQAALRNAEAGVNLARSSLWPALSANYTRSRLGPQEFPSSHYNWTFGGVLSFPLFGGGPTAAYYALLAARKNREKAEQDLRAARDSAVVELESSWSGYATAEDQAKIQTALLEAARERHDEADVRYASGLLSYDTWEIIASDRINSERQSLQAYLNTVSAQAAWEKALGKGLGD